VRWDSVARRGAGDISHKKEISSIIVYDVGAIAKTIKEMPKSKEPGEI
jgi:hypothetical protein